MKVADLYNTLTKERNDIAPVLYAHRDIIHRKRRAVGAIIGGVILTAILLTTILVYFVTILNNEKARFSYQAQAAQDDHEKAAERMLVLREHELSIPGNNIQLRVSNNGSLALVYSHVLLHCISVTCASPEPIVNPVSINPAPPVTLNPAEASIFEVGPVSDGLMYRIDVISEQGNIVTSIECLPDLSERICVNDGPGPSPGPPCESCPLTDGIIQGTGSVQLDFRAFGAIFPTLGDREGVNQKGWRVVTAGTYGNATGYPGFEIPYQIPVVYVEKMRNLDPSGNDIKLAGTTSLITYIASDGTPGPGAEFICNATRSTGILTPYNQDSAFTVLPHVAEDAELTEGWREVYFCSNTIGTVQPDYIPSNQVSAFHPIFMVLRGQFDTKADYGQTVPYQASMPGNMPASSFNVCLRDSNVGSTQCPPVANNSAELSLKYFASQAEMRTVADGGSGPTSVWIHINNLDSQPQPVTVSWIYPDGTIVELAEITATGISNINIGPINLPTTNSDGTPISCTGGPGSSEHFILKVNDNYNSSFLKNVYYMTFKMNC